MRRTLKTRTGILLALGAGIAVFFFIWMKMVQPMLFGLDLVEMERTVLPAALICVAGAFVGYYFFSDNEKSPTLTLPAKNNSHLRCLNLEIRIINLCGTREKRFSSRKPEQVQPNR